MMLVRRMLPNVRYRRSHRVTSTHRRPSTTWPTGRF